MYNTTEQILEEKWTWNHEICVFWGPQKFYNSLFDWDNSNPLEAGETSEPNVSPQKSESLIRTYSRRKMDVKFRNIFWSLYEWLFSSCIWLPRLRYQTSTLASWSRSNSWVMSHDNKRPQTMCCKCNQHVCKSYATFLCRNCFFFGE